MFTLRHSVENASGKINVFIKSCTISLKLNDWFHYSPIFTQFNSWPTKWFNLFQCPLSRLSSINVKSYLGLLRSSKSWSHLLCISLSSWTRKINNWLLRESCITSLLSLNSYPILNPKCLTLAFGISFPRHD